MDIIQHNQLQCGGLWGSFKGLRLTGTAHLAIKTSVFHPEVNNGHVLVK
jgi:hypothetical protein